MNSILTINAHLKYVEFLLHVFDNYDDSVTLGQIRSEFVDKFSTQHVLLNQNFGVYRLLPLMLIKEEYKRDRKPLEGIVKQIKQIRDSIAHNDFSMDENGYNFNDGKSSFSLSYSELTELVHKIENNFHKGLEP